MTRVIEINDWPLARVYAISVLLDMASRRGMNDVVVDAMSRLSSCKNDRKCYDDVITLLSHALGVKVFFI